MDCVQCHTVTTWESATFEHSQFPLTNGHSSATCTQCHASGTFEPLPTECLFCHQADYVSAPSHVASNFPQTCESCHSITIWGNATYDHSFFPLSGGHNGLACISCHTTGTYGTIPSDCASCHQSDYQLAPGHVSSGFPMDCIQCHSTTTWLNATFDHGVFSLSGGHNGVQCVSCHTTGTYGTIPSDCFSCHQSDYNGAPDHQSLQFPHDCESCHSVSNWSNVNFLHSFPLSGPHNGRDCVECHDAGTTQEFSCLGACHEHTASKMNSRHQEESGYAYDFFLCLSCHPDGRH
jgi:hypothetical protein